MGILDRAKRILKSQLHDKVDRLRFPGGDDPLSEDGAAMDDEAWYQAAKARQAQETRQRSGHHRAHPAAGPPDEIARAYANLDCPPGSDLKTVREAWKRLMKKYHPDRFANEPKKRESATKLTALLNESYQKLETHLKRPK